MVSRSSASKIRERTRTFCKTIANWNDFNKDNLVFSELAEHLKKEYDFIPDKERVGKGRVYISRYIAKECYSYLKKEIAMDKKRLFKFSKKCLKYYRTIENSSIYYFAMIFLSEYIKDHPEGFKSNIDLFEEWATYDDWKIREGVIYPIIAGLKKAPDLILPVLSSWAEHKNENIRRMVAESLRPKAEVKWLRNPDKNDDVLNILTKMRMDQSIYVRKAVGNNIKDLSKYMPEKMLDLMESWLERSKIRVYDKLATEEGLNTEKKRLIWTMKQAMRWIKDRNPEFHGRLEDLLGKHYILYFDEKRNRLATPPSNEK
ncbi:MAG: hypothetical protein EU521_01550 [Promethearchaeota archaeon]|nr:MAG: hypothetical protein EU521_01550 [Candidatus Lokiarchaeota archaeon]